MAYEHKRGIGVPKEPGNPGWYAEIANGYSDPTYYDLAPEEFWAIEDSGFFIEACGHYHQLFDDWEMPVIDHDLEWAMGWAERIRDVAPTLYAATREAMERGTGMYFEL